MHKPSPRPASARVLALLAIALLSAGCATVQVEKRPPPAPASAEPGIDEARSLARDQAGLAGQARIDNAQRIERLLAGLDDASLARAAAALPEGDPLYPYAGRALIRRGLPLPRPFDRGGAWRFDPSRPPADADGYRPPRRLAVLLPLSGNLATAAAPVRDGLLAGYYGENRRRPEITFYDTLGTPYGAGQAYRQATAEGNDLVLGPLGRDEVGALFRGDELTVPVLALNRADVPPPAGNASFSLSPEDEGSAAAEYLLAHGARRVLVLANGEDGMRRAAAALAQRLSYQGGSVAATLVVAGEAGDIGAALASATARAGGVDGGVDGVFLAVRGARARALAPQLAAAGLAGKLRVGTSQLLSGTGDMEQDRLLDGIAFPSERWGAAGVAGLPPLASVAQALPTARGPAARLFAFGYDAWLLAGHLEALVLDANGEVRGATGVLRLDADGNVLRTPAWSTFSSGVQVPLADAGVR